MSTQSSPPSESDTSKFRITLSDVTGVGPSTLEKLHAVGIESIEKAHLLRQRTSPSYVNLKDRGVSKPTLEHLRAVGSAVYATSGRRVRAKHLTADFASDIRQSRYVSILDQQTDAPSGSMNTDEEQTTLNECNSFNPDSDELAEAIEAIQEEYSQEFADQHRFQGDINRFLYETDHFDKGIPTNVIHSVVRYHHPPDRVTSQRKYEPFSGAFLIAFSEWLDE